MSPSFNNRSSVNSGFTTPSAASTQPNPSQTNPSQTNNDAGTASDQALQPRRLLPQQSGSTSSLITARVARQSALQNITDSIVQEMAQDAVHRPNPMPAYENFLTQLDAREEFRKRNPDAPLPALTSYRGPGEPMAEEHSVLAQFAPRPSHGRVRNDNDAPEVGESEPQPTVAQTPQPVLSHRGPGEALPEDHSVLAQFAPPVHPLDIYKRQLDEYSSQVANKRRREGEN